MDFSTLCKMVAESSLGIVMAIGVLYMFYRVLMHVLKQQEGILLMATEQNIRWQKAIEEHTIQAKLFHDQVSEAHKYQREEHYKMQQDLAKITVSRSS